MKKSTYSEWRKQVVAAKTAGKFVAIPPGTAMEKPTVILSHPELGVESIGLPGTLKLNQEIGFLLWVVAATGEIQILTRMTGGEENKGDPCSGVFLLGGLGNIDAVIDELTQDAGDTEDVGLN